MMLSKRYHRELAVTVLILVLCTLPLCGQQTDSIKILRDTSSHLGFRSFQIDAVSIVFINGVSIASDVDLIRISRKTTFGIRGIIEKYNYLVEGSHGGSFLDYSILGRTTTSGTRFRWDIYLGPGYHTRDIGSPYMTIKLGMEFRYYLIPKLFGIMLKLNKGSTGIGIVFGYDT